MNRPAPAGQNAGMTKMLGVPAAFLLLTATPACPDETLPGAGSLPAPGSVEFAKMRETYSRAVEPIFEKKCFACHYSAVKGSWFYRATYTRKRAMKDLDLAGGFPFSGRGTAEERIRDLAEAVREGSMPPFMRRLTKPGGKITDEERKLILAWLSPAPLPPEALSPAQEFSRTAGGAAGE